MSLGSSPLADREVAGRKVERGWKDLRLVSDRTRPTAATTSACCPTAKGALFNVFTRRDGRVHFWAGENDRPNRRPAQTPAGRLIFRRCGLFWTHAEFRGRDWYPSLQLD